MFFVIRLLRITHIGGKRRDRKFLLRKKCPYSELFWSAFSHIRTEYGEILRISPYSVRMRENADKNNFEYGYFVRSVCFWFNFHFWFNFLTTLETFIRTGNFDFVFFFESKLARQCKGLKNQLFKELLHFSHLSFSNGL